MMTRISRAMMQETSIALSSVANKNLVTYSSDFSKMPTKKLVLKEEVVSLSGATIEWHVTRAHCNMECLRPGF